MSENYQVIKGYQEDDSKRKSFNQLASATFGLQFEQWYEQGYWKDNYIPYSILNGDKIVANVSVSPMQLKYKNDLIHVVQLGTVMTEKTYRKQGFIRRLMNEIEKDYEGKVDGYFLFANDSVLEFYPKFGFYKSKEFIYSKEVQIKTPKTIQQISMKEEENKKELEKAIKESEIQSDLWLQNNKELTMFYATSFMSEEVYKVESQSAYVIATKEKEVLYLTSVIASYPVNLDAIIEAFGSEVKKVMLGFTPLQKEGYQIREYKEEDTTLFIKGEVLKRIENKFLRIPQLAHA